MTRTPFGFGQSGRSGWGAPLGWMAALVGRRELYSRVEEDFPTWQEFSRRKLADGEERGKPLFELPPHKVYVSSPLQWNFLFFLMVVGALAMGYAQPDWAPYFIYGAILLIFALAVVFIIREGIFFHLEGQRLAEDCDTINRNAGGPRVEPEPDKPGGFWKHLLGRRKSYFRSTLLQIHYQNVFRTFEQGNRRAQVGQEASISEIHTVLSQRGMKLVWTFIEVLPQLGLLGTLIGLGRMFFAFNESVELPELAILSGFGTALGTTILANLFVLILRPLYMRNERAMNEILSSIQMLMAVFILPTQHHVLGRGLTAGTGQEPPAPEMGSARLARTVEQLNRTLLTLSRRGRGLPAGEESPEPLQLVAASESRGAPAGGGAAGGGAPIHVDFPSRTLENLTDSVETLAQRLDHVLPKGEGASAEESRRIEAELGELRTLNRDTMTLIQQVADDLERIRAEAAAPPSHGAAATGLGDSITELPGGAVGQGARPRRPPGPPGSRQSRARR